MASKELTAKVKLNTSDVESKLKKLEDRIKRIQDVLNGRSGSSGGGIDAKVAKAAIQAEKLNQAAAKTLILEQKLTQQQMKTQQQQARSEQAQQKSLNTLTQADKVAQRMSNHASKQWWQETLTEQARQRSLKALGDGDKAAQRLAQTTERTKRAEYERWWQEQLISQELKKQSHNLDIFKSKVTAIGKGFVSWVNNSHVALSNLKSFTSPLGKIGGLVSGITKTVLTLGTIKIAVQGADTLTGVQNRLNNIAGMTMGDSAYTYDSSGNKTGYSDLAKNFTQDAMDKMYIAAQNSRSSYSGMMNNVSKTMTLASGAFDNNIDKAIRFQEVMGKAFSISGASAAEMSTSMYQLTQALGSGVLQGDELRSVREGASLAYQEIEKFAQGVLNTNESLKDLASEGKITSEMVVEAVLNMGNSVDQVFALTKYRFSDVWNQIKSAGERAFQPVVQMLTDMLNEAVDNGLIQKAENLFNNVAKVVMIVFKVISNVVDWISEHWDKLKHVIIGGLILIGSYMLVTGAISAASAIMSAMAWATTHWQLLLVVMAIAMIIYAFILFKQGVIDATTFAGMALLALAAIMFLIFGWQVALVFAVIALVVMFFDVVSGIVAFLGSIIIDIILIVWNMFVSVINLIIGSILWAGATVYNIFAGVVNACLQVLWSATEPFIGVIEWILNACNGGFNSFGGAVANLIGQVISWFLSLGKVVTKIIDAIFGTDWTGGLESLQDKVLAWGKTKDESITIDRNAPELPRIDATNAFNTGTTTFDYAELINPLEAYDAGHDWGSGISDSVNSWASKWQNTNDNSAKQNGLLDNIGNTLGLDFSSLGSFPGGDSAGSDYAPDYGKVLDSIDGNTGSMADSLDLSTDDLERLRKIADTEWKKEYTTAEIHIDMHNTNTINNKGDLDNWVTDLRDMLAEDLVTVADGVY